MNFYLSRNLFMPLVNRILDIFVYKIGFINPVWISSFRIYGSLIFLFHFLSILPDFYTFWGQNAMVNPDIMDANIDNLMPTIYDIHQLITQNNPISFNKNLIKVEGEGREGRDEGGRRERRREETAGERR